MQSEKTNKHLENFSMMIPQNATYCLSGCVVVNATKEEWDAFKLWLHKEEFIQLGIGHWKWNLWARNNDLVKDDIALSLQRLFEQWKNKPEDKGFQFSYHSFKK